MGTCNERREELVELVFGELDEEKAARLNLHLVECERCRREERELLRLRESLAGEEPEPEERLKERLRSILPARRRRRPLIRILRAPVPAYAAAAAVALTALLLRDASPAPDRSNGVPERIAMGRDEALRFTTAGSYETWAGGAAESVDSAADSL